jgi:hypothetical protein
MLTKEAYELMETPGHSPGQAPNGLTVGFSGFWHKLGDSDIAELGRGIRNSLLQTVDGGWHRRHVAGHMEFLH